jgi:RIO-like serine/threonine protein kinase
MASKNYFYIKENVFTREYRIYKYLDNLNLKFIPKLYDYDKEKNILKTQRIKKLSVADFYGDKFENVPENIIEKIRNIITDLYNIGIVYPDITGYNFIEDKNSHVWIVDFEHCFYINHYNSKENNELSSIDDDVKDKEEHLDFVNKFCFKNENSWNPYFA